MNKNLSVALLCVLALGVGGPLFADHSSEVGEVDVMAPAACHIDTNLSIGSLGDEVKCLQKHLIEDGLLSSSATGYFGEMTKAAVAQWQEQKGLPATGYFGPLSRATFEGHGEKEGHAAKISTAPAIHPALDVALWPAVPSVAITVHKDAMAGWNLEIKTENFRFAPEHASGVALPNEGHAHLMVGGKKLARVYGNWFHIPQEAVVGVGPHEVLVTLNANDHSDLAANGIRVEARQMITIQ